MLSTKHTQKPFAPVSSFWVSKERTDTSLLSTENVQKLIISTINLHLLAFPGLEKTEFEPTVSYALNVRGTVEVKR